MAPDIVDVLRRFDATYDAFVHEGVEYKITRRVVADRNLIYLEYGLFKSGANPDVRIFEARETYHSFVACKAKWSPSGNHFHGLIEAFPKEALTLVKANIGVGEGTALVPLEMEKLCYGLAMKSAAANRAEFTLEPKTEAELRRLGIDCFWNGFNFQE